MSLITGFSTSSVLFFASWILFASYMWAMLCLLICVSPPITCNAVQVLLNQDDVEELKSENRILRPLDEGGREVNRIKPNPSLRIQPVFLDPGPSRKPAKGKQSNKGGLSKGLCMEITGRVQHDRMN
jgi:hypothetical protein